MSQQARKRKRKRTARATPKGAASSKRRRALRDIGAQVRRARLEAKLTQEEAAARANIDYKRWQRLEYGEVNPTATTLLRVADAVEVDVWRLLTPAKKKKKVEGGEKPKDESGAG